MQCAMPGMAKIQSKPKTLCPLHDAIMELCLKRPLLASVKFGPVRAGGREEANCQDMAGLAESFSN